MSKEQVIENKIKERTEYLYLGDMVYIVSAVESDKATQTPLDIIKELVDKYTNQNTEGTRYLNANIGGKERC